MCFANSFCKESRHVSELFANRANSYCEQLFANSYLGLYYQWFHSCSQVSKIDLFACSQPPLEGLLRNSKRGLGADSEVAREIRKEKNMHEFIAQICPECNGLVRLSKAGTFEAHYRYDGASTNWCGMSGEEPGTEEETVDSERNNE